MSLRRFDALWSDPHVAHRNIIEYCNRPFGSTWHQEEELIRRYNALVSSDHHVLCTGDLFLPRGHERKFMDRLNGRKSIVAGNHDRKVSDAKLIEWGFEEVITRSFFHDELDGIRVCVCHYPYSGFSSDVRYEGLRPPREDDVVLIHGHCHLPTRVTHDDTVHVGVDAWDYGPAPIDEVSRLVRLCFEAKSKGLRSGDR